jgi:hypothetical protein
MGRKITRMVKEKVIREWIQGLRRNKIAKINVLGDGTVTAIIQEASKREEYHDMALFRQLALLLNENSLGPFEVGFAIRIMKIMEQNDIDTDQIEALISEFAAHCYEHNLSINNFVQSARECLNLSYKFRIHVEEIPEFIVQGKKVIDNLEEQRQVLLREKQCLREERNALINEIQKYGKEKQLIEQIKELKRELYARDQLIRHNEEQIGLLKQDLANENRASCTIDEMRGDLDRQLSLCQEDLEKCKKESRVQD